MGFFLTPWFVVNRIPIFEQNIMHYNIYEINKECNSKTKRSTVYTLTTCRSMCRMQCGQIKLCGMRKFGQDVKFNTGNQGNPGTDFDRDTK
jgi:hypothetical protein